MLHCCVAAHAALYALLPLPLLSTLACSASSGSCRALTRSPQHRVWPFWPTRLPPPLPPFPQRHHLSCSRPFIAGNITAQFEPCPREGSIKSLSVYQAPELEESKERKKMGKWFLFGRHALTAGSVLSQERAPAVPCPPSRLSSSHIPPDPSLCPFARLACPACTCLSIPSPSTALRTVFDMAASGSLRARPWQPQPAPIPCLSPSTGLSLSGPAFCSPWSETVTSLSSTNQWLCVSRSCEPGHNAPMTCDGVLLACCPL